MGSWRVRCKEIGKRLKFWQRWIEQYDKKVVERWLASNINHRDLEVFLTDYFKDFTMSDHFGYWFGGKKLKFEFVNGLSMAESIYNSPNPLLARMKNKTSFVGEKNHISLPTKEDHRQWYIKNGEKAGGNSYEDFKPKDPDEKI